MRLIEQPGPGDATVRLTPAGRVVVAVVTLALLAVLILGAAQGLDSGQGVAEVVGPIVLGLAVSVAAMMRRRRQRR